MMLMMTMAMMMIGILLGQMDTIGFIPLYVPSYPSCPLVSILYCSMQLEPLLAATPLVGNNPALKNGPELSKSKHQNARLTCISSSGQARQGWNLKPRREKREQREQNKLRNTHIMSSVASLLPFLATMAGTLCVWVGGYTHSCSPRPKPH